MAHFIISVGIESGDFRGSDSTDIQAAADEVARRGPSGGGVLLIKAGAYTMYDSLHIRVPMTVRGEGPKTVLKKCAQFRTRLLQDFDLSEYVARAADVSGLRVGMGVTFKDKEQESGWSPTIRSIVAIDGNDVRVDRRPERDYAYASEAWLQNSFPIISACGVDGVSIKDLVTDGNRKENADVFVDGCRAGGIYLHEARRCTIRRCIARDFNGDGISWQTTEDITVEDCEALGNACLGLHPGTGSPRTIVRNCKAHHNGQIGLFLCWGVKHGRFENNILEDNGNFGVSIGHKDTDNVFVNNYVRRNGEAGFYFRDEIESTAGHRCTLRSNIIESNGTSEKSGVGIKINGQTRDTVLESNTIRGHSIAVLADKQASNIVVKPDNKIEGEIRV
jgi:parallel beta-helix repeat protein